MDIDYRAKYLKYKSKYLTLKNSHKMVGGGENSEEPRVIFFKLYGCGPCNRFKPVWDDLINKDKEKKEDEKLKVNFELITNNTDELEGKLKELETKLNNTTDKSKQEEIKNELYEIKNKQEKLKIEFDKVTNDFGVNSFPTIIFEKNRDRNTRNQFNNERTVEKLVEWIKHNKQN